MANAFTDLAVAGDDLPIQQVVIPGATVEADNWQRVLNTLANVHAYGQSVRVSQGFRETLKYNGNATITNSWRIPLQSTAHTAVRVWCHCRTANAGPKIRAHSTTAADSVDINPGLAFAWQSSSALTVTSGLDYEDVYLSIVGNAGGAEVEIKEVAIEVVPLTTPLAASVVGDFVPSGASTNGADYALTASRLQDVAHSIGDLLERPRAMMCWAAPTSTVATYIGTGGVSALEPGYRSLLFPFRTLGLASAKSVIYWRVTADATDDGEVFLRGLDGRVLARQDITAGTGTSWYAEDVYLERAQPPSVDIDRPTAPMWIDQSTDGDGASLATISAFSVWGP